MDMENSKHFFDIMFLPLVTSGLIHSNITNNIQQKLAAPLARFLILSSIILTTIYITMLNGYFLISAIIKSIWVNHTHLNPKMSNPAITLSKNIWFCSKWHEREELNILFKITPDSSPGSYLEASDELSKYKRRSFISLNHIYCIWLK